ncbi:MAG: hypothetical protein JXQ80_05305 [Bacteroidales bacterium]|nr:hypothetical protein [Bacteroidales bacterium]
MTINKNNYEAYLLDYIEGNLDPLLTAELMAFLAENPAYDQLLDPTETNNAVTGSQVFAAKNQLKKDLSDLPAVTPANFEEFCIAACEGTLSSNDSQRLSNYIDNDPVKLKTLALYRKVRLSPDLSVIYNHKGILRKPAGKTRPLGHFYAYVAVAASIVLLTALWIIKPRQEKLSPLVTEKPTLSVEADPGLKSPVTVKTAVPAEKDVPLALSVPVNDSEPVVDETHTLPRIPGIQRILTPLPGRIVSLANDNPPLSVILPDKPEPLALLSVSAADGSDPVQTMNLFAQLADKIDFWKTAETAVQGFNHLTEAQVSINRTIDDEGKTTALLLETERYSFSGKKWK